MWQPEMIEIGDRVRLIINIGSVSRDRVPGGTKWRNTSDVADPSSPPGQESGQTEGLPAKDTNLEKIRRPKFCEEQEPKNVKGILTEPSSIGSDVVKVRPMAFQLGVEFLMKESDALQIKLGWSRKTF